MKTDLDIIAEQCAEIDRRNGREPLTPVRSEPLLACPFCGHDAIASVTGKFARCGNEDCFLGQPDFFLDSTKWNTRDNNPLSVNTKETP